MIVLLAKSRRSTKLRVSTPPLETPVPYLYLSSTHVGCRIAKCAALNIGSPGALPSLNRSLTVIVSLEIIQLPRYLPSRRTSSSQTRRKVTVEFLAFQ